MPTCGYACVNCGRCKGRLPKPILVPRCIECGHENPFGSETCEACGASLQLRPGVTSTAGPPSLRGKVLDPSQVEATAAAAAKAKAAKAAAAAKA